MRDGFIKTAAVTPRIRVADVRGNVDEIVARMREAAGQGAHLIVFPELCITGYTCGDLFLQQRLLDAAREGLREIAEAAKEIEALVLVGLPLAVNGKLYNVAAGLYRGEVRGLVPKRYLPTYNEFYELRHFVPGEQQVREIELFGKQVPFGMSLFFSVQTPGYSFGVACEICEDLWVPDPPSRQHAQAGAVIIANLSASDAGIGKREYRRSLVANQSARLFCGYVYASAGEGESSQDLVFSGHDLIAENGYILAESAGYDTGIICSEIDVLRLDAERRRHTSFEALPFDEQQKYISVPIAMGVSAASDVIEQPDQVSPISLSSQTQQLPQTLQEAQILQESQTLQTSLASQTKQKVPAPVTRLTRTFARQPFVPADASARSARCEEILTIQAMGLKKRVEHVHSKTLVVGLSGGLDSTLALLVMVKAADMAGLGREQIIAVTMPGFGTTDRTYTNACRMAKAFGCTLKEVSIAAVVTQHFADIGHDGQTHDVTYENSQARERTQILMDIANLTGGLVIGTGDMSELALGWATYNGDHISMYGVNCSVPKTLVRHLVRYYSDTCEDEALREVLYDVLDTPVSPELLPPKDGQIAQITEDLVGPYELHDFFLYYILRFGYPPMKVLRIARESFAGVYDDATILKWLKTFYWRFFAQQFKRSCIPDGPKVGSVALSPRGDLRMPSDAVVAIWREELDAL